MSQFGFGRGFDRLNEIVAHTLREGVPVEATRRPINVRHRMVVHRFIYFGSKPRTGLISAG